MFLLLFFLFASLHAEVVETNRFRDIEAYLEPDTLLILDIDNTLMETAQALGSDQWFYARVRHYQNLGSDFAEAIDKALPEWMAVQSVTKVKCVEETTPSFVKELQEKGVVCMGLTSRGLGLSDRTIHQLWSLGFDLKKTSPSKEELFFFNKRGVLYREGILFTAGTHKGQDLFLFLDSIHLTPKKIVFINDRETHIREVEKSVLDRGIPFIGLRYGATDETVASMDEKITDIQWEHFGKILSDDEAKALALSEPKL